MSTFEKLLKELKDADFAAEYLEEAYRRGERDFFIALADVAYAGGMPIGQGEDAPSAKSAFFQALAKHLLEGKPEREQNTVNIEPSDASTHVAASPASPVSLTLLTSPAPRPHLVLYPFGAIDPTLIQRLSYRGPVPGANTYTVFADLASGKCIDIERDLPSAEAALAYIETFVRENL